MYDKFRKDLEKYSKDTSKIFENVAKKGAIEFVNQAKKLTAQEKLVDTGYYRRNWYADAMTYGDINVVYCENSVEYASYLEDGHKLRNGKRWPGRKIGQRAIEKTEVYCIDLLQKEIDKLLK